MWAGKTWNVLQCFPFTAVTSCITDLCSLSYQEWLTGLCVYEVPFLKWARPSPVKASSVTDTSVGHLKDSCQPVSLSQGSIFSSPPLQRATVALTGLRAESVPVSAFFSIFHDLKCIGRHDGGYFSWVLTHFAQQWNQKKRIKIFALFCVALMEPE